MTSKLARWCDGLMEAGWLAAIIAIPLFFNIHSDRVFEPDKLTLLRSIALLMSAAWLVKFIDQQSWQKWSLLHPRNENSIWRMPFVLPVFLLVLTYLISNIFSVTPRVSWAGSYQRLQGTYTTLSYIVIFALIISTMRSRGQVSRVITAVIITSIPISFYALLQHFEWDPLPWGGNTSLRVAGHMGNAIFIAAYLIMAVPVTIARIIDAFTSILSDEELSYADVIRSSIYIFIVAIQLLAIYWSGSRGPWLGLAAASFAFILIVLVTLRNATSETGRFRLAEIGKAFLMVIGGAIVAYLLISSLLTVIVNSGRLPSLAGPMTSFVSFASAVGILVVAVFIMIAARRGWRWLWFSWLLLTVLVAGWLAAFNFAGSLNENLTAVPLVGNMTDTFVEWQELPTIGRLGQLLESEGGTGRVRVLIWTGVLELISLHEPIQFPNGEVDRYNFLRPLFGYGPESMYVAYNSFYQPQLATIEARNASPDRSHNETFDALVITGGIGFIVWQVLYLSVFYYGFRWLGVVRSTRDRNLLIALWIIGALVGAIVLTTVLGMEFLGVAIPFGSIAGLVIYLIYYALFAQTDEESASDPFALDRLLMIGLVTAVLAHYVEIHFGIAIAATRTHFFVYLGLMVLIGHLLPQLKSQEEAATTIKQRRQLPVVGALSTWQLILAHTFSLALVLGILAFEFITYSLPPGTQITSATDLTAGDIFYQSFFVNPQRDFNDQPFLFMMIILTWSLGVLISLSEMVKNGDIHFSDVTIRLAANRRSIAGGIFLAFSLVSLGWRFLGPAPGPLALTSILGRSLLLAWGVLCLLAAILLFSQHALSHRLAGIIAAIGFLFALPLLVAGTVWFGLIFLIVCGTLLYLLWDKSWGGSLGAAAVFAFVSLPIGLFMGYVQAVSLRSSIFFTPANLAAGPATEVARANQSAGFLTLFYALVISLIFLIAFTLVPSIRGGRRESLGTTPAFIGLVILMILSLVAISRTNMRIIQADIIYKRGKPFDQQAGRANQPVENRLNNWNTAIAIYEDALEKAPLEDFYYLFLGRAYLELASITPEPNVQLETLNKADAALKLAQDINPLNTDHTANLARLNTRWIQLSQAESDKETRYENAVNYYDDALALSPQNSVIRNEKAGLVYQVGQSCPQAIDILQESLEVDPYYEQTYVQLANILTGCSGEFTEEEEQNNIVLSADALEDAVALDERNPSIWFRLGQTRYSLAQYEEAIAAFNEARAQNTGRNRVEEWRIDYAIALAYQEMGDEEKTLEFAQQALTTAPPNQANQIQLLIQQLTGAPQTAGESVLEGDRPLATLTPTERNNFYSAYPPLVIDTTQTYDAIITTNKGEMRFRLFTDETPLTVNNFAYLATQGFYDGIIFHRVLENFMAQAGDPTGTGGGGPGYRFEDEITDRTFDQRGYLAMANAGPGTNGSQFFITFVPTPHLNGQHTIFGTLIEGDEVLSSIQLRDPSDPAAPADMIEQIDIVQIGQ